jgi:hypothetical protein
VEYKQFFVKAFERRPGKGRARVKRLDGKPILVARRDQARVRIHRHPTMLSQLRAIADIDAGAFSRRGKAIGKCGIPRSGIGFARAWGPEVRTTDTDYIVAALIRAERSTCRPATPLRSGINIDVRTHKKEPRGVGDTRGSCP